MRRWLLLVVACFPLVAAGADLHFPALSGRVVDEAHLLSAGIKQTITDELAQHEQETGNQVVVVTLPSLQGMTIEDYGYQLGRHWGIGQKDKDNGVLLIVAPNDRAMRIEVGYGLEGVLTDALCSQIIQEIILPRFKDGQLETGIFDGTNAILATLSGHAPAMQAEQSIEEKMVGGAIWGIAGLMFFLIFVVTVGPFILFFLLLPVIVLAFILKLFGFGALDRAVTRFRQSRFFQRLVRNVGRGGGGSGGGFSGGGGGFSGGGGSFGGGGSSGRW